MTIDTILAGLKERHGASWPEAAVSELLDRQEWLAPGSHSEYVAFRDWCEHMIAAGVAATSGDSVAGLVRGGALIARSNLAGEYFYLYKMGDRWHVRGERPPATEYDDEAAAVRTFREASNG